MIREVFGIRSITAPVPSSNVYMSPWIVSPGSKMEQKKKRVSADVAYAELVPFAAHLLNA